VGAISAYHEVKANLDLACSLSLPLGAIPHLKPSLISSKIRPREFVIEKKSDVRHLF
jgi:hypothetical protein